MKKSDKPTNYLLLKAGTNSEWDNCNFAIVQINEEWRNEKRQQLHNVKPFIKDYNFMSLNVYDTAVNFFVSKDGNNPDLEKWLSDKQMVFVEFNDEELHNLSVPENTLKYFTLKIYSTGTAIYKAYGKHTGEEFYTEEFPLIELMQLNLNNNEL
ncbi:hypothetical protein [Chryseobacterium sp.]|uniref:hypothetical protein n=1 Tax=Chryseobacterium sp. TaxID=1871047 RepID=UPI003341A1AB